MIYVVTQQILPESDKYEIINPYTALELLKPLRKVGLDTETKGFDPYTKELLLVQMGNFDLQVVIDVTTVSLRFFKEYLESDRLFLGWNLIFDYGFLLHQRIVIRNVWDGYLAEKLLWLGYPSGIHSMSLQSAADHYLGVKLDKTVRGKIIWSALDEDIIVYAAHDVKYLEKIKERQEVELKRQNLHVAIQYENKSLPWVAYTEYCGVLLSVDKWLYKMELDNLAERVYEEALNHWVVEACTGGKYSYHYLQTEGLSEKELKEARAGMKGERAPDKDIKGTVRGYFEAYKVEIGAKLPPIFIKQNLQGDLFEGFKGPECIINWKSPLQVAKLLKYLGFDLMVKDKDTGELTESTKAEVIASQSDKSTISYLYISYKEATKVTSTYGGNVLKQINPVSGRIHTKFHQLGTDTARLSSGGEDKVNKLKYLNFQNFPADAETRACFIAAKGNKWISRDYNGQESRIMANVTNDPAMIELFNHGCGDVHSLVAKMTFPEIIGDCPIEEIKEKFHDLRSRVKSEVEFAINYGGNADTIHMQSGKPKDECDQIYHNYMSGFKGIATYQKKQREFVMANGYILMNPKTGYRAHIYDYNILSGIKNRFNSEFWDTYKMHKGKQTKIVPIQVLQQLYKRFAEGESIDRLAGVYYYKQKKGNKEEMASFPLTISDVYVYPVKYYFRRKSTSEKQAINYPCQHTGAVMFKLASIFLWDYLLEHDLIFKVKLCIPSHDEWNIEVPEELADEINEVLADCMERAGAFFCTKVRLFSEGAPADYWIH